MLSSKYEAEHDSSGAGVVPGESGDKVKDIRDTLRREGYDVHQLTGKSVMRQLREIIRHT